MSENRRSPQRETVQALVGVSVIAIGLVVTAVLHFTHDASRSHRGPSPAPMPPPATAPMATGAAPSAPGLPTGTPCCEASGPAALGLAPWPE
ncbi:hypothetical protein [Streptomyces sp. SID3343]|uniref:hypothetical protein n=1 Tax=Streptomyces sp. SID3343 TaxID=2690260 RepID=UPI001371B2BD|nr:hypothetical protein [Streptomyces sp. SID3343]MYW05918.1 hypothetical protein [Streptomyces sp. SID3343]